MLDAPMADGVKNVLVEAAEEAQRRALLEALEANNWNLTATAVSLRLHGPPAVLRYIKQLGLTDAHAKARAAGKLRPGPKSDET